MEKENKQEKKETRTEKSEIAKIKNTSVLKILSFISIAIFFLPIYSDWGWLFSILHSKEPTAVSVPIFTFSFILFIVLLTNIGTDFDMKNGFKRMYDKDVVITRSNISFYHNDSRGEINKKIGELLADKFKKYKGQQWVPMIIELDETNKADGLIGAGQLSGKATMGKPGFNGSETLKVSFIIEVVTNPFQFRELSEGGYSIIHNYKK